MFVVFTASHFYRRNDQKWKQVDRRYTFYFFKKDDSRFIPVPNLILHPDA